MKNQLVILFAALLFGRQAMAKITLPGMFSDGMVLQQQANAAIWGSATHSKITVKTSWNHKIYITQTDAQGAWKLNVATPTAGGPYDITISDGESITIKNVLIGEVWICAGQSNMEMPVIGFKDTPVLNAGDVLFNADEPEIRILHVKGRSSATPQSNISAVWQQSNAKNIKDFSAVGYQFAALLYSKLKVPIGIIETTVGGTAIQLWTSKTGLSPFPQYKTSDTAKVKSPNSGLYNGMVAPLIGYKIKGMIWYQGEANVVDYKIYDQLMAAMVTNYRKSWNQPDMGFYYVQIAPCDYRRYKPATAHVLAPYLREAQERALALIPNSYMAGTLDAGEETTIHPPDKSVVSKRLATAVLAKEYGREGLPYLSPVFKEMALTDTAATLTFDNLEAGLTTYYKPITGFEAAGDDRVFYPAIAKIKSSKIEVRCDKIAKIKAVRYCFKDFAPGSVFNAAGLPLLPFRTDSWEVNY